VDIFWKSKKLDPLSNVQFGEGGAGAFSDGKLTARTRNIYTDQVFDYLIKFGADPDIAINALPHLGTDKLFEIIRNIKKYLLEKGCKLFYNHKLQDIILKDYKIAQVVINNQTYEPEIVILAVGNSARDIFTLLERKGIPIENKAFAVGLRIEHSKDFINHTFYGEKNDFSITGDATYKLTAQYEKRGVYSFCMCPGGYVIPACSETDGQVVNGMSYSLRDNSFSNSGIVVNVDRRDFGDKALDGMIYQRELEKLHFHDFMAPSQKAIDFLQNKRSERLPKNSYYFANLAINFCETLPSYIQIPLAHFLKEFERKFKGFASEGLLMGVETRTSSPVRIIRDSEKLCSVGVSNLYPIGEGSGYAGGIISSAADGIRLASI
jgi:uncharacterized FAD-dependent dehydrogenase